jgi:CheY-like chemotaxis protein
MRFISSAPPEGTRIQLLDMLTTPKSILIVTHDEALRTTRVALLESGGYKVSSVESDDQAMALLETDVFDLVLVGRKSGLPVIEIDERLRGRHPNLLILKIEDLDINARVFASRNTDPEPNHVLAILKEMLGE